VFVESGIAGVYTSTYNNLPGADTLAYLRCQTR